MDEGSEKRGEKKKEGTLEEFRSSVSVIEQVELKSNLIQPRKPHRLLSAISVTVCRF